ncbi:hypothetical protein D3C72_722210 [compost metagenome]
MVVPQLSRTALMQLQVAVMAGTVVLLVQLQRLRWLQTFRSLAALVAPISLRGSMVIHKALRLISMKPLHTSQAQLIAQQSIKMV